MTFVVLLAVPLVVGSWIGCFGDSSTAKATVAAVEAPAAPMAPMAAAGPKAPTRAWNGLTLGESGGPEVAAYVQTQGIQCEAGPSLARESFQVRCAGPLPLGLLPDRVIGGQLAELLLSRPESGPINTISTLRKYSLPDDAARDYNVAVDALTKTYGAPLRGGEHTTPEKFDAKVARVASVWRFADLEIRLTAMRASGGFVGVSEVWLVPGVEEQINSRPGVSGHGGQKAKNPHAIAAEGGPASGPASAAPPVAPAPPASSAPPAASP